MKRSRSPVPLILLAGIVLVTVLGVAAYPTLMKLVNASPQLSVMKVLEDIPLPPERTVVMPVAGQLAPAPWSAAEALGVRELVWAARYDSLEQLFRSLRAAAMADARAETRYFDAYVSFSEQTLGLVLDEWVRARPASVAARIARASRLVDMAFERRGTAWANETSQSQFQAMQATLDSALADARDALRSDPSELAGYWVLMRAAQTPQPTLAVLNAALRVSRSSVAFRASAIANFRPRWGGSYELMQQLADEAQQFAEQVPELNALRGFVDWDLADVAARSNDEAGMMQHLEASLAFGEAYTLCRDAARLLRAYARLAAAQRYAECAVRLRPSLPRGRLVLARVLYGRARQDYPAYWDEYYPRARDEASLAFQLDSLDKETADFWQVASDPFRGSRERRSGAQSRR